MALCTPAHIYLVVSLLSFVLLAYYDRYHINASCLGSFHCNNNKPWKVYLVILAFIAFWTWILQLQCTNGLTMLAWAEIILPILAMFIGFQINWNPLSWMNTNFIMDPKQI